VSDRLAAQGEPLDCASMWNLGVLHDFIFPIRSCQRATRPARFTSHLEPTEMTELKLSSKYDRSTFADRTRYRIAGRSADAADRAFELCGAEVNDSLAAQRELLERDGLSNRNLLHDCIARFSRIVINTND
jgi:hypothetical protein